MQPPAEEPPPADPARPAGPSLRKQPPAPASDAPRPPSPPAPTRRPAAAGQDEAEADDPTDHYVPPQLPPLPPSHPVTKYGLVALGLGLVLLLFPMLLGLEHTTAVDVAGVLCIVGAVGLLVSRLSGRSTDDYEGPDDGAVV